MPYRFIHAADIHLDSPLRSLALRDPQLGELIGNATRTAFVRIIDLCLAQKVDALLIAGDLYDGDQTSMKTARFLAGELRRLDEAGIDCFIIRGNHDALSKITRELVLPERVHLFGAKSAIITPKRKDLTLNIAIHGLSFAKAHAPDSLLPQYQPPVSGAVNVGMMHTSLNGAAGHDLYAPCSTTDLQSSGFTYWALGHIHKRDVIHSTEKNCTIVMAGNPQGRDINEAGEKSVTLVTIHDDQSVSVEQCATSLAQFERVPVDASGVASGAEGWRELAERIGSALNEARSNSGSEHLVARLQISGVTPLAWQMRRDHDLLKTEADERAAMTGNCWVEKLELDCQPQKSPTAVGSAHDPLTGLRHLIDQQLLTSPIFRQDMQEMLDAFLKKLPVQLRASFGDSAAEAETILSQLLQQGSEDVLAQLSGTMRDEGEA